MMKYRLIIGFGIFHISYVGAQELPLRNPAIELNICEQQSFTFLRDNRQVQTWMAQFINDIANLTKELAEAKSKMPPYPIDPNISD